jgi:hypothetical protein
MGGDMISLEGETLTLRNIILRKEQKNYVI